MQAANSLALGTSPVVRALIDPEGGMEAVRNLDNVSFADWFRSHGGSQGSIDMMWDPIGAFHLALATALFGPPRFSLLHVQGTPFSCFSGRASSAGCRVIQ